MNEILDDTPIAAAVDGKVAKQMKDENGEAILMLNVFAQNLKLHLASWSVRSDKTNEPGCLKQHLEELFAMYPCSSPFATTDYMSHHPLLDEQGFQGYHVPTESRKSCGLTDRQTRCESCYSQTKSNKVSPKSVWRNSVENCNDQRQQSAPGQFKY